MKILMLEDDPEEADWVGRALAAEGDPAFAVECVDQLATGLVSLADKRPDAILLDLSLPDAPGLDGLTRVRAQAPGVAIVALIGPGDEPLGERAIREGAHEYVVRGRGNERALIRALRHVIDRVRVRRLQAAESRAAQLQVLDQLAAAIAAGTDRAGLMRRVVECTARLLRAPYAVLWTIAPEQRCLVPAAELVDESLGPLPPQPPLPLPWAVTAGILQEGACRNIPDVRKESLWANASWPGLDSVSAYAGVPLEKEGTVLGVLGAMDRPGRVFTAEEVELLRSLGRHAAFAIDTVRLLEAEREATQRARTLVEVGKLLTEMVDLETVLSRLADTIVEVLGATASCVGLVEESEGSVFLRFPETRGLPPAYRDHLTLGLGEAAGGKAVLERRTLWTSDLLEDPGFTLSDKTRRTIAEHAVPRAVLAAPIVRGDIAIGSLTAHRPAGAVFTPAEVELLTALAAQAGIAIENANLYGRIRESYEEVMAIHEAGQAIAQSLDLHQTLRDILRPAMRLSETDLGSILLVNESRQELAGVVLGAPDGRTELRVALADVSFAGACLREGRTIVSDTPETDPRVNPTFQACFGNRALIAIPLRSGTDTIGVLHLADRRRRRCLSPRQVALLERLAQQAAVAIQNARLYGDVQAGLEAVRRQHDAARALLEVSQTVTKTLELDTVLTLIVEKMLAVTGADACSITRISAGGDLEFVRSKGFRRAFHAPGIVPRGEGLIGRCRESGIPVWSRDLLEDPAIFYSPETRRFVQAEGMRASLAVPIVTTSGPYGVLYIGRRRIHDHTEDEVAFVQALAAQAGIAIENARLYAEVRSYSQDLERKVAERTAEVERANRAKSEFLANMSHELRTPLNSIIGFGDLLKLQHAGPLNPKQIRYVQNIQAGGVHLLNLVNDILDLARIEAGRLVLQRQPTALEPLVTGGLEAVRPEADKKDLALGAEIEADLPAIAADPLRLRQILANLLSNAIKFTGSGGNVTVRARRIPPHLLEIEVEDTGIGIAPEDLHRLFQKFEQLETGATKSYQGTGLGLALSRRLAEMHGGSIAVHSAGRGRGSTFTVRLPIDGRRERPAVLLVDDDPQVRRLLTDACRWWGWELTATETLAQARAALERGLPDLVILDAALPDGSGTAFAREFRRGHPAPVPILMHTGLGAEEGQAALEAGADDYLAKPTPLELIRQKASRLLALAGWPECLTDAPVDGGNGDRAEARPVEESTRG